MGTYIAGYFIPKEIVDEIIDLASALEGPEPAMMSDELASLALVQRGWRERAHRHLFESISLRSLARCEKLLHLFATSSGLASYVRRVHIDEGPNDSEEAPWVSQGVPLRQALAMLPNVEALSLARVGFWAADVILSQVPSPFIRTSTLELQFVAVNNLTNLAPYVSALPALRAITIYETTMLHAPADVAAMISGWTPQLDLRPWVHRGVTRLCVRASVSEADDASIQALTLRTVFPSVCEVEVLVVSEYDIDFAATLTRSYGAQLTTIKIDTRGWDEDRCAGKMTYSLLILAHIQISQQRSSPPVSISHHIPIYARSTFRECAWSSPPMVTGSLRCSSRSSRLRLPMCTFSSTCRSIQVSLSTARILSRRSI
jgi:hypothetical protein